MGTDVFAAPPPGQEPVTALHVVPLQGPVGAGTGPSGHAKRPTATTTKTKTKREILKASELFLNCSRALVMIAVAIEDPGTVVTELVEEFIAHKFLGNPAGIRPAKTNTTLHATTGIIK